MGQIHALALQLITKGIIELIVYDNSKIGTDSVLSSDLRVHLPFGKERKGVGFVTMPAYCLDSFWEGINIQP